MRCPICKQELKAEAKVHRPFCSARCKSIDLGNWLTESYRVPVEDDDDPEASLDGESGAARKPIGDA